LLYWYKGTNTDAAAAGELHWRLESVRKKEKIRKKEKNTDAAAAGELRWRLESVPERAKVECNGCASWLASTLHTGVYQHHRSSLSSAYTPVCRVYTPVCRVLARQRIATLCTQAYTTGPHSPLRLEAYANACGRKILVYEALSCTAYRRIHGICIATRIPHTPLG